MSPGVPSNALTAKVMSEAPSLPRGVINLFSELGAEGSKQRMRAFPADQQSLWNRLVPKLGRKAVADKME